MIKENNISTTLKIIVIIIIGVLFTRCESPHYSKMSGMLNRFKSLTATFLDGSGEFHPESKPPYGDTIKIDLPYYYPIKSSKKIDISKMRLSANLPNNTKIEPRLSVHDLQKPLNITVKLPNGKTRNHVIIGDVRRSSKANIVGFSLPKVQLSGYVIKSKKLVGLVSGDRDLSGLKPKINISPHARISPDPSKPQNFNEPINYTVTADDGTQSKYTVRKFSPNKVNAGIRKGSVKLLWKKNANDLNFTKYMETAIATSDNYLVLNTRNQDLRYYNRFDGKYIGKLGRGELTKYQFQNFNLANDTKGNLLACNLALSNKAFVVYLWNKDNLNTTPKEFIKWKNNTNGQVGRKLSISGNLDKNAVIFATVTSSGTILRWDIVDGVLQSQKPQKIHYTGNTWSYLADAVSIGNTKSDNIFLAGYPSDIAYVNSSNGKPISLFDLEDSDYIVPGSLDYLEFNNANYLASLNVIYGYAGRGYLYDVTSPTKISTPPDNPGYSDFEIFKTPKISANNNGNDTGDIILKKSKDGYKMTMYVMLTNGGVAAYQFDDIDINDI